MARTRRVTTDEMTQVEALAAIEQATSQVNILVADAAQASGISQLTIRKQIAADKKNRTNTLGFGTDLWGKRYIINRESFVEHEHAKRRCTGGNAD